MTTNQDLMKRLRNADPARDAVSVPPIDRLLARIAAEPGPDRAPPARRRRIGIAVAGVTLALATAGAIVVLDGGSADVVAEARAALEPQGWIIHTVTRSERFDAHGTQVGALAVEGAGRIGTLSGRSETWTALDPLRERMLSTILATKSFPGGSFQTDYAHGVMRFAKSWDDRIVVRESPAIRQAFERNGDEQSVTQLGSDPVAGIRRLLGDGSLKPAGEAELGNRRLLALTGHERSFHVRGGGTSPAVDVEYLIDPDTSAPVRITYRSVLSLPGGRRLAVGFRTTFETYERIPLRRDTQHLLRISDAGRRTVVRAR